MEIINVGGKAPPHSPNNEKCVIGAILRDNSQIFEIHKLLKPEAFYSENNRIIFTAIMDLFKNDSVIDLVTLATYLYEHGTLSLAGGTEYLVKASGETPSAANILEYAKIVHEKYILRQVILTFSLLAQDAYLPETDALDLLKKASETVDNISDHLNSLSPIKTAQMSAFDTLDELVKLRSGELEPIYTGFQTMDSDMSIGGFNGGDFVIIGARPGMGKSAFMQSIIKNNSIEKQIPCGYISLEMTDFQNTIRFAAMGTNIPVHKIRKAKTISEPEFQEITAYLLNTHSKAQIYSDVTPALKPTEFKARVLEMHKKHRIKYLVVDYLQLMNAERQKGDTMDTALGTISHLCKNLAKELDIPIFGLAQLNRRLETTASKRPSMADLRESGNFEQDADYILLLYRPEVYGLPMPTDPPTDSTGKAVVFIEKARNSKIGTNFIAFDGATTQFRSLEYMPDENDYPERAKNYNKVIIENVNDEKEESPF